MLAPAASMGHAAATQTYVVAVDVATQTLTAPLPPSDPFLVSCVWTRARAVRAMSTSTQAGTHAALTGTPGGTMLTICVARCRSGVEM